MLCDADMPKPRRLSGACVISGLVWLRGQDLNLRPSGYEPDELPGCSTPRQGCRCRFFSSFFREILSRLSRSGGDLLSHVLRRSTIGAAALNGRVRDGIGCFARARATRPGKRRSALSRDPFEGAGRCCPRMRWKKSCFFRIKSSLSSH